MLTEGILKAMRSSEMRVGAIVAVAAYLAAAGVGAIVLAGDQQPAAARELGQATNPTMTSEIDRLQETWVRISTGSGGKSRLLPKSQRNTLSIEGTRFRFAGPAASPRAIDLTPTGDAAGPLESKTDFGIYELEDDTLMTCLDVYHKSERPTAFTTKPGDRQVIDLYKRSAP